VRTENLSLSRSPLIADEPRLSSNFHKVFYIPSNHLQSGSAAKNIKEVRGENKL